MNIFCHEMVNFKEMIIKFFIKFDAIIGFLQLQMLHEGKGYNVMHIVISEFGGLEVTFNIYPDGRLYLIKLFPGIAGPQLASLYLCPTFTRELLGQSPPRPPHWLGEGF